MKRFISLLLILATLFAVISCGEAVKEPQKEEDESPKPVEPLSKIEFVIDENKSVPKNETELDEMLADLKACCDDGRNIALAIYGGFKDLETLMEEKGFYFRSGAEFDINIDHSVGSVGYNQLEDLDGEFLLSLVKDENMDKIVLAPGGMYQDPDFPTFDVTMYMDSEIIEIANTRQLQVQMDKLVVICQNGEVYKGVGLYLHGFEVQASDLTGIPYTHISYGTKDEPMTVLSFGYEAIAQLEAELVVDMLSICPYFTSVEFFLVTDINKPVLDNK